MLLPLLALAMLSPSQGPSPDAQVVTGLQAFSRALIGVLPSQPGRNLIASPFSVSECLALLLPGVGISDAAMIAKRLHMPGNPSDAGEGVQALNAKLSATPNGELIVANSLWTGPRYHLTAAYQNTVQAQFGAQASALPNTGLAGVKTVNDWIGEKTKGRILNLLQTLDAATSVVLVNAVSFDARWQTPFKSGLTAKLPFHGLTALIAAPTMSQRARMAYGKGPNYQVAQLSYASGGFSMLVFLPDSGVDPVSVLKSLDLSNMPAMTGAFVEIQLPKFNFSSRFGLMGSLGALGLGSLAKRFDASPMLGTSQPMTLSQLLHGAEIEVDENGTRAAAATIGAVAGTAIIRQPEPVVFHVDRPFAFVIVHTATQAPLFEGAVYDPTS